MRGVDSNDHDAISAMKHLSTDILMPEFGDKGFSVAYTPVGDQQYGMPAKSLSASLSAFAELFEVVDGIVSGKQPRVQLTYEATREGSVECVLEVIDLVSRNSSAISAEIRTYASLIREIVVGSRGLFAVIPRRDNSTSAEVNHQSHGVERHHADGSVDRIDKEVAMVLAKTAPRDLIWATLAPTASGVCSKIELDNGTESVIRVDEDNINLYRPDPPAKRS